mmetsp:Transcript_11302/g.24035  ORF Transcript_11302/g.24035 Transcript_11302/m.24035 type:complete len:161 (-) Transcript_11302:26-508(-)
MLIQERKERRSMKPFRRANSLLMHAQDRNANNKMFGGHLMRVALELAWANAFTYARATPTFLTLDNMFFFSPVEIGSLVNLRSTVAYKIDSLHLVLVSVQLEMVDPTDDNRTVANHLNFLFRFDNVDHKPFPEFQPRTYNEILTWLEGRRRMLHLTGRTE